MEVTHGLHGQATRVAEPGEDAPAHAEGCIDDRDGRIAIPECLRHVRVPMAHLEPRIGLQARTCAEVGRGGHPGGVCVDGTNFSRPVARGRRRITPDLDLSTATSTWYACVMWETPSSSLSLV